jgi:hypothetical protein
LTEAARKGVPSQSRTRFSEAETWLGIDKVDPQPGFDEGLPSIASGIAGRRRLRKKNLDCNYSVEILCQLFNNLFVQNEQKEKKNQKHQPFKFVLNVEVYVHVFIQQLLKNPTQHYEK